MQFGTDGVRGIIDEEFTEETVEVLTRAVCRMLSRDGRNGSLTIDLGGKIIVQPFARRLIAGYDRRRRSDEFAGIAADVASQEGFETLLADRAASTPALSYAVKSNKADGAIVITASHNPPEFNGLKFKPFYAGSSVEEVTGPIEAELNALQDGNSDRPIWMGKGSVGKFNPATDYIEALRGIVDIEAITDSGLHLIFDPIHGAAAGMFGAIFDGAPPQAGLEVDEIRGERDINFGGVNPEPLKENLGPLIDAVIAAGDGAVGIATDGDGDRLGVVGSGGVFYSSQVIFPLLMRHLIQHRGKHSGVARTFSVSELVDAIGAKHGVPVYEEPIGFKYLAAHLVKGDVFLGGEESGGIGFDLLIPERCGVMAALILLEACAERGKDVNGMADELFAEYGAYYADRIDLPISRKVSRGEVKDAVQSYGPRYFAKFRPRRIYSFDGTKINFSPRGFILFRPSGTEPMLRIYAETDSAGGTAELLNMGRMMLSEKTDLLQSPEN